MDTINKEEYKFLTAEKVGLDKEGVVELFKAHQFLIRNQVIEKYDFSAWNSKKQQENAAHRLYKHVQDNPSLYSEFISEKEINQITEITKGRSALGLGTNIGSGNSSVRATVARPIKDMNKKVEGIISKMANVLDLKLDYMNNKKEIQKIPLVQLTTAMGTMIDKSRLMRGEATEHVAHLITEKGVDKMSKDDILTALSDQRSKTLEAKQ